MVGIDKVIWYYLSGEPLGVFGKNGTEEYLMVSLVLMPSLSFYGLLYDRISISTDLDEGDLASCWSNVVQS